MKKLLIAFAALAVAAGVQAATLNWGSGGEVIYNKDGTTLQNSLVQLMVDDGTGNFTAVDSTYTYEADDFGDGGDFAGVWKKAEGYAVADYPAGRQFFYRVYAGSTASDDPSQYMDMYANGINAENPTYWTLSATADNSQAQGSTISDNSTSGAYSGTTTFTPVATPIVPEPTTYALVGLAAAALALRKRLRK